MTEVIVDYINSRIQSEFPYFEERKKLCEIIQEQNADGEFISYPAEYFTNGEYKQIDLDFYNGIIYYRMNGDTSISEVEDDYVSGCDMMLEVKYPMRLVGSIKKDVFNDDDAYTDMQLAENISSIINTTSNRTIQQTYKLEQFKINVTSLNTNRAAIIGDEYNGLPIQIRYDRAYFAVEFETTIRLTQACFQAWSCGNTRVSIEFCTDDLVDLVYGGPEFEV